MNRSERRRRTIGKRAEARGLSDQSSANGQALRPVRPTVVRYMTPSPHSIGREQTLATAHALMRKFGIRHLPVLEGGKLVGIVSQRDLYFVESLQNVDPNRIKVEEAMSQETYAVQPDTAADEVAHDMMTHKYGCAVVMDHGKVVGIFTTTDALRALSELLAKGAAAPS